MQEKMNVALEQLLPKGAIMGFWHRELELSTELSACLNDAQAAKTIREAKVQHKSTAHVLQQAHLDNMLVLEHEAMATEGRDHGAFTEAFGVAVWTYPLEFGGPYFTHHRSLPVTYP